MSSTVVEHVRDYASSGLTLQAAFVDHVKRFPAKDRRPPYILWEGRQIVTADALHVPSDGVVRAEIIARRGSTRQGFDLKVNGWLELTDGSRVTLLRTWDDPEYEPVVEYPFGAPDGLLRTWNVYEMHYPAGRIVEEKWTGNAGFWVEALGEIDHIYHCSHGMADPPDFESLVYRVTVTPRPPAQTR